MIEKELVKYAEIVGEIVIGKSAIYVSEDRLLKAMSLPVLEYDEATETFMTEDVVYTPA